ncbi:crotonase/enoyl-CoA hydratase family protein [Nocardia sp. NPDC050435]|uniref:crotonase/enoyl-CoA hydratase family protein n=1 Tax=Nocardia sp. NPDC050435 TaxID=3155040 RepID=UPI0033ED355E
MPELDTVLLELQGHVLRIGLHRPAKGNSFNRTLVNELALAYGFLEQEPAVRSAVLYGEGPNFTTGLDLADLAAELGTGKRVLPDGGRDPFRLDGAWTKPVIAVAHGWTITAGIELLLAADIRIATTDTRFTQLEVRRGILPFGGATIRFPRQCGWANAMRWMLTGEEFDAEEALRIGLVQELAADPQIALQRATDIASAIADKAAPLAVAATLRSAQLALTDGDDTAAAHLGPELAQLSVSADALEGVLAFAERREAQFQGM